MIALQRWDDQEEDLLPSVVTVEASDDSEVAIHVRDGCAVYLSHYQAGQLVAAIDAAVAS